MKKTGLANEMMKKTMQGAMTKMIKNVTKSFLNSRNAFWSAGTLVPAVPSCGLFSFSCDFEGTNRLKVRNDTKQKKKKKL